MMLRQIFGRGVHLMVTQPRQVRMMHNMVRIQQQIAYNQMAMVTVQQRNFGGKRKKKNQDDASETEPEVEAEAVAEAVAEEAPVEAVEETVEATPEPVPQPEPVVEEAPDFSAATEAQPPQEVAADLFGGFSVGSVKVVNSAPGNKPPIAEDTIEGRYAGVLFTSASE